MRVRPLLLTLAVTALTLTGAECNGPANPDPPKGEEPKKADPKPPAPAEKPKFDPAKVKEPKVDQEGKEWGLAELGAYLKFRKVITEYEINSDTMMVKASDGTHIRVEMRSGPLVAENAALAEHGRSGKTANDLSDWARWGKFVAIGPWTATMNAQEVFCVLPGAWDYSPGTRPHEIGTWEEPLIDELLRSGSGTKPNEYEVRRQQDDKRRYLKRIADIRATGTYTSEPFDPTLWEDLEKPQPITPPKKVPLGIPLLDKVKGGGEDPALLPEDRKPPREKK